MADVVIVGGGAAGCALAYRLSADPEIEVLLLECGSEDRPDVVSRPHRWPETVGRELDYGFRSTPQRHAHGRQIPLPRGRLLGGSTGINAMIHAVPPPEDFECWGAGWSWSDVAPAFDALVSYRTADADEGHGGPMRIGPAEEPNPLCADFISAAAQAGHRRRATGRSSSAVGTGWFDLAVRNGRRVDAATAYLGQAVSRPNLRVRTGVEVRSLQIEQGRVIQLMATSGPKSEVIAVDGDVVLCAGAVASPALLLRSGLGPKDQLESRGLRCLVHLPAVGQNLHDHPLMPMVWSSSRPVPPPRNQLAESYLSTTSMSRSTGHDGGPVLHAAFMHVPVPSPGTAPVAHGATALIGLYQPRSRGRLTLDPADVTGPVLIDPDYLSDRRDGAALEAGVDMLRTVAVQPALEPWGLTEVFPLTENDSTTLSDRLRDAVGSFGHLAGTCAIGSDGVVDAQLRVHGLDNLRIADASVIPTLPRVAPSATAQMVGWRAAELIATGLR